MVPVLKYLSVNEGDTIIICVYQVEGKIKDKTAKKSPG